MEDRCRVDLDETEQTQRQNACVGRTIELAPSLIGLNFAVPIYLGHQDKTTK